MPVGHVAQGEFTQNGVRVHGLGLQARQAEGHLGRDVLGEELVVDVLEDHRRDPGAFLPGGCRIPDRDRSPRLGFETAQRAAQRRLARPVAADEGADLTCEQIQIDLPEDGNTATVESEPARRQEGVRGRVADRGNLAGRGCAWDDLVRVAHPQAHPAHLLRFECGELAGRHDAAEAPVLQEHVAVGDPGQPGQAVLGDEHRAPRFLRVFHELGHVRCRGQIQVARRLVEQQVRGVHGPDAREGHLLAFPTRELENVAAREGPQAQFLEGRLDAGPDVLLGPARAFQGERHLPGGVHVEELGAWVLEEGTRPPGDHPRGEPVHGLPVEQGTAQHLPRKEAGCESARQA